jgi:hypothetical protein
VRTPNLSLAVTKFPDLSEAQNMLEMTEFCLLNLYLTQVLASRPAKLTRQILASVKETRIFSSFGSHCNSLTALVGARSSSEE